MISPILLRVLQDDPIVISGMGAMTAAGFSTDQLWTNALNGNCPATWQDFAWGEQTWRKAVPPMANCFEPEFLSKAIPLRARPIALENVMSNSLGFWGKHASILLGRSA